MEKNLGIVSSMWSLHDEEANAVDCDSVGSEFEL